MNRIYQRGGTSEQYSCISACNKVNIYINGIYNIITYVNAFIETTDHQAKSGLWCQWNQKLIEAQTLTIQHTIGSAWENNLNFNAVREQVLYLSI